MSEIGMPNIGERPQREWWPAEYMDELMPQGFATPEEWLKELSPGEFTIKSPYHDDPEEEAERKWPFEALTNGQRLDFVCCDLLGELEIEMSPDGSYTITSGTVHPDANLFHFWAEPTSGHDSLEELVKYSLESDPIDQGDTMSAKVILSHWSDTIAYSVKIEGGLATLERAGTA